MSSPMDNARRVGGVAVVVLVGIFALTGCGGSSAPVEVAPDPETTTPLSASDARSTAYGPMRSASRPATGAVTSPPTP